MSKKKKIDLVEGSIYVKNRFFGQFSPICLIIQYQLVPMLFTANFYDQICLIFSCNKFLMSNKKKIHLVEGSIYV